MRVTDIGQAGWGKGETGLARTLRASASSGGAPLHAAALGPESASLPFAGPAPDAESLAAGDGKLPALGRHRTTAARSEGFGGGLSPVGEEQTGVEASARRKVLPTADR
jgi:hypothetical protein